MENKKTPETLKPEQMESGKWYHLETYNHFNFVLNFEALNNDVKYHKAWNITKNAIVDSIYICPKIDIKSIRHATKEEVLKYFPDEVFENVSLINEVNNSQVTEQQKEKWSEKIDEIIDTHVVQKLKPEPIELRPEETELEKLKKLLEESNRLYALKTIEFTKLQEKYEKLLTYNDELTERINQTETKNNQEKVYFYRDRDMENIDYTTILENAITNSDDEQLIYEAICIGKKKSVLVSE